MEHIKQFDWCYSQPDIYFLKEDDLSKSVTEKILRNKFHDPLVSSDSEEERPNINWDEVFIDKQNLNAQFANFVPCLPKIQYPKQSALDAHQHYKILKVICAQHHDVFKKVFIPRPTKTDLKVFEELKPIYEKEQKEYMEWAKTLWTNVHCVRALRPKPIVETVYEASFKMRANEMKSYPKFFDMAAQIPLETRNGTFDMILDKELISVDIYALPQIECKPITKKLTIMRPCSVPEPCNKHQCRFILPNEKTVSILPFTEIQRELAQFALDNSCQYVASENALRCLVELDRSWDIPVSVCSVLGPDGETTNIVVLGNEFSVNRELSLMRTYRAFRHLLQHTLIPSNEKYKLRYNDKSGERINQESSKIDLFFSDMAVSSDEDDDGLCIDEKSQMSDCKEESSPTDDEKEIKEEVTDGTSENQNKATVDVVTDDVDIYGCTCKDTLFERPPPRSFKKWKVINKTTDESFNVMIHCSHKIRDTNGEVILEPLPEYQLDLGGSQQSRGRVQSLALALYLRKNVSLMNVRVDGATGEVATFEPTTLDEIKLKHQDALAHVTRTLHCALAQLHGLRAGHYALRHEPGHGANALLFAQARAGGALHLAFDCARAQLADDLPQRAPALAPALLPYHKHWRVAPCAFTPHEQFVARPAARLRAARPPPRALQWPKKKRKRKRKN